MTSPLEIEQKEFDKQIRGYNKEEVRNYLFKISNEFEELIKKNEINRKEIKRLEDELKKFNRIEKNLSEALVVAKETANEVVNNAKTKADNIVKESEMKAEKIIGSANQKVIEIRKEHQEAKKEMKIYKMKMKSLIESQLELNKSINVD